MKTRPRFSSPGFLRRLLPLALSRQQKESLLIPVSGVANARDAMRARR
ncbi:hypothetical protein BN1221_01736 [Brenneria goodwinii]|uniref:Uncharacterized protein n=1 Tax=Brenneria goodwinii TaxID=1109412 RepID=A0A0G4JTS3_9GAMM|nr:hypothetical protein BN1221_01736 [Brenneria goodwinii]